MNIHESKINNIGIELVKAKEEFTPDNVLGYKYFSNPYGNTFLISKKNSGKSTVIYNIVKNTVDKRTKVMIFSGSIGKDHVYDEIIKYCKKKDIPITTFPSFIDANGNNLVQRIMEASQAMINKDEREQKQDDLTEILVDKERPKRKRKKKIVPEMLLIFDDLGATLRNRVIATLGKLGRHFKIRNVMSFHVAQDAYPDLLEQGDFVILFGGYPEEKLEKLFERLVLSVTWEQFYQLYKFATKEKYNFLYCDVRNNKYRRNFNFELDF
jgi:hypothetical protein